MHQIFGQPKPALDELVSSLDLQALAINAKGDILHANEGARFLLGANKNDLNSMMLDSLFSPRNPEWLSRDIRKTAQKGNWTGDAVMTRFDGSELWVHIRACAAPCNVFPKNVILMFLEDVTENFSLVDVLAKRNEELFVKNRELEVVNKVGKIMLADSDLDSRISAMLKEAARTIGVDGGCIFIKNITTDELVPRYFYGDELKSILRETVIGIDEVSFIAESVRSRHSRATEDITKERTIYKNVLIQAQLKSVVCVPFVASNEAFGAIVLYETKKYRTFSIEEITLVEIIANFTASAIYSSLLSENVKQFQKQHEELCRASRLASVGELLAGAAHNFGNLVMILQGNLELAREDARALQAPEAVIGRIDKALNHLTNGSGIIHRLLNYSHGTDAGTGQISIYDAIEAAIELCSIHPSAWQRKISNLISREIPKVSADLGALQEVVLNLVINALQATEPGGEIKIEAQVSLEDRKIQICVTDNGHGIDPDNLEHIFDPFFSTKEGTGLGLPTSAAIIQRMGGAIQVESTPGKGSTFIIKLPVAEDCSLEDQAFAA